MTHRFARMAGALILLCSCAAAGAAEKLAGAWPQWRGPNRDGISAETGLLKSWPNGGPKLRWTYREAGNGFSGPAVVDGVYYGLGSDDSNEFAFALDLKDGKEVWKKPIASLFKNNWGDGPRGTPTVDGDFVYALAAGGNLLCLKKSDGAEVWRKSCTKDFGGKVPFWGYSESPLVDGDKVLVTPGGKNCVVALDKKSGETVWKSTGLSDGAHYSSLVPAEVGGVKMYVTQTEKQFVGVGAADGKLLWKFGEIGRRVAVIPTPIVSGDTVYVTAGYGAGCECLKLTAANGEVTAEKVYVNRNMANHHGGVILHEGRVFGHADGRSGGWTLQDLKTGEVAWRKNKERGEGLEKGCVTFADGLFYCFGENTGDCVLVDAEVSGWKELGRMKLPEKTKLERKQGQIWTHPVVAEGKLFLRDLDLVFCFDVKEK